MDFFRWAGVPWWWLPLVLTLVGATCLALWLGTPGALWRADRRAAAIRQTGRPAQAVVLSREDTGMRMHKDQFVVRFGLRVTYEGKAPFDTTLQAPVSALHFDEFAVGNHIQVRVDPATGDIALDSRTG